MPRYLVLCNFTDKGLEQVKESVDRLERAKQAFKAVGAELKEFYLLMGEYDIALIAEAPDDRTATSLALSIGSRGAIRAKVDRAYTEDEYRQIIRSLP